MLKFYQDQISCFQVGFSFVTAITAPLCDSRSANNELFSSKTRRGSNFWKTIQTLLSHFRFANENQIEFGWESISTLFFISDFLSELVGLMKILQHLAERNFTLKQIQGVSKKMQHSDF